MVTLLTPVSELAISSLTDHSESTHLQVPQPVFTFAVRARFLSPGFTRVMVQGE